MVKLDYIECNICHWVGPIFNSDKWHLYTVCPNCRSEVRHRLFWALVNNVDKFHVDKLFLNKAVLHFAPEHQLGLRMKDLCAEYKTADILVEGYSYTHIDYVTDITDMDTIDDASFDCVLAFDVLEHIPEHLQALREIARILKPGGYCIVSVPQKDNLDKTIEDLSITDPKERERLFAQEDHVRMYGNDFLDIFASGGFEVCALNEQQLPDDLVEKHVLFPPILSEHPLATNYRKIFFGKKRAMPL